MKTVSIKFIELTKEEASKLTEGQVLVYNPLTGRVKVEDADDKKFTARNKNAVECLVYLKVKC